jgi:uncharacterized protein with von Willebrand factor type A (vWA) domain
MLDAAQALEHVAIGRRTDFYFTLRALLVHRQQDLTIFDEAFRLFWRRPPGQPLDIAERSRPPRFGRPHVDIPLAQPDTGDADSAAALPEPIERTMPTSHSAHDVSRSKDFADFTQEEIDRAQAIVAALTWDPDMRVTQRWIPGKGRALDWRRLVRHNLRLGGEIVAMPRRTRSERRRPLVLLCDVSGSMERYARMLLYFMNGLVGRGDRTEAFVFATRLTRITRELRKGLERTPAPAISRLVPDWAGGTRIGEALHAFNISWARRVMTHAPVVLLISDGWDRGEPAQLAREMSRLQRSSRRLIWLNPLLGAAGYQPLTRGMQAALPFIDDFLPVHNLASLEMLAVHLNQLPGRRSRGIRRSA